MLMTWGLFLDRLVTEDVDLRQKRLLEPFRFLDAQGRLWTAPAGMVFDGTSIPWSLWTVFRESPFTGHAHRAAVIHDAGCKGLLYRDGGPYRGGFRDGAVHGLFYDGIRADGGSAIKAWLFYRAVWAKCMIQGGFSPRSPLDTEYRYEHSRTPSP